MVKYLGGRAGHMRGFLINKNLCFYYWLRKRIGKRQAYRLSNTLEKVILIFGREAIL
jgi:hypothetical protein